MFAKRALARGDDPEEVIRRIAYFRSSEKSDPLYYARLTVKKAQTDMGRESVEATNMRESEQNDVGRSSLRQILRDEGIARSTTSLEEFSWGCGTASVMPVAFEKVLYAPQKFG